MRLFLTLTLAFTSPALAAETPPNVLVIMTDDQGYGDVAAHGHPHLKTPHMDRLRGQSVRLEQFHVDPTCSPTRAALLTGRYSSRTGVWHTIMGRNMVREGETIIAELFRDAGYRTGIFGKWHLGDTYPYAPRFRGFVDASIVHFAGGAGQAPDYWGNDYFDDHYNDAGTWRPFEGYCTDVWFREALRFIEESKAQKKPFFLYLPTNAAHQTRPHVPEHYRALYDDVEDASRAMQIFWGMITNIDDNLGIMLERLESWDLLDNTVLIFMGDNGTQSSPNSWPPAIRPETADWQGIYNAGMRGSKGSHYDGGHRVFAFIHYPDGGIVGGRDVPQLTAHIDIMPTLLELAGIPVPEGLELDGSSLVPLLTGDAAGWPDRTLIVHNQRVVDPIKGRNTSVMTDRWRLVDDRELFDIHNDPAQQHNLIADHPELVASLRAEFESWWQSISTEFHITTPLHIGSEEEPSVQLSSHDWMADGSIPWNQPHVTSRMEANGPWHVRVARAGRYAFVLRERPESAAFPLTASSARLRIGDHFDESLPIPADASGIRFETTLPSGDTDIHTWLIGPGTATRGAYYVEAHYLE